MSTLASRRGELERAVEIATVLFASGFGWLLAALGLEACVSPRCRFVCSFRPKEQCPHHVDMALPLPERMRGVLERLGPTFVKAGQMLALRPDYVPLEYAEALRSLHDAVPPFPGAQARSGWSRRSWAGRSRSCSRSSSTSPSRPPRSHRCTAAFCPTAGRWR